MQSNSQKGKNAMSEGLKQGLPRRVKYLTQGKKTRQLVGVCV